MSWITDRDAKTQANYRYIDFEGARILQAWELEDFQATEVLRTKWANMALFREGALVNVKGTYAAQTITFSKIDAASSVPMLAMVNGSFEPIPAAVASVPVAQAKVNATDPIYLHWVLWKVTYDGANSTRDGQRSRTCGILIAYPVLSGVVDRSLTRAQDITPVQM